VFVLGHGLSLSLTRDFGYNRLRDFSCTDLTCINGTYLTSYKGECGFIVALSYQSRAQIGLCQINYLMKLTNNLNLTGDMRWLGDLLS
jgi:hypothetical protein